MYDCSHCGLDVSQLLSAYAPNVACKNMPTQYVWDGMWIYGDNGTGPFKRLISMHSLPFSIIQWGGILRGSP